MMVDKILARDRIWDYYPPGWSRWSSEFDAGAEPSDIGFSCNQAQLNRFAARYRVAHAFAGVRLKDFREETADGYAGLFPSFSSLDSLRTIFKDPSL